MRPLAKLVFGFFAACALATLAAWAYLLSTLCSNPRAPADQHVVPYNCHGMTVFISPLDETMLHWLIPVFVLFALLGVLAGVLAFVRVKVHVDTKVKRG